MTTIWCQYCLFQWLIVLWLIFQKIVFRLVFTTINSHEQLYFRWSSKEWKNECRGSRRERRRWTKMISSVGLRTNQIYRKNKSSISSLACSSPATRPLPWPWPSLSIFSKLVRKLSKNLGCGNQIKSNSFL